MSQITQLDTISCMRCGDVVPQSDCVILDEDHLCPECATDHTFTCEHCGRHEWNENDYGDDDISLCEYCRDEHYVACTDCGSLIRRAYANYEEQALEDIVLLQLNLP